MAAPDPALGPAVALGIDPTAAAITLRLVRAAMSTAETEAQGLAALDEMDIPPPGRWGICGVVGAIAAADHGVDLSQEDAGPLMQAATFAAAYGMVAARRGPKN